MYTYMTKVAIYYISLKNLSNKSFLDMYLNPQSVITSREFNEHYTKVYDMELPNSIDLNDEHSVNSYLESLFEKFNSDENPLAINDNKIHTTMSVCDIIQLDKKFYCVCGFGFKEIQL